ncbi:IclR family transcriptional regulator [Miniphocaeibacter halophilus]|uniref:IclR family transcriptional regulator n=1 Tax=Miniphocaeibacter halophilus TaxID=2931922 RepID=A0AC61MRC6_9FIRM|nr:IclR family transcriptional regulator [Miniphocaeibacter halophilus]QQK08095.1 IclR family transcriptional regulator [Miniphocaeibacter halophilus]
MAEIVQSLDRALNILEIVAKNENGIGIKELSERTSLHKSTVHRLLHSLIYKGFVEQDEITGKYFITFKLYELGINKIQNIDLVKIARPYVEELMDKVDEVVHLVVRDGNYIVYVDKVESKNTIRMFSTIGKRTPLYCSSVGKAITAHLSEEEVEEIWNSSDVKKFTPTTITDFNKFKEELKNIRNLGYAIDNEENEIGVRCIGAPIFNIDGKVESAISVSGPANRMTDEKLNEISNYIRYYANKISERLGYNVN